MVRLSNVILVSLLAVVLSACGDDGGADAPVVTIDGSSPVDGASPDGAVSTPDATPPSPDASPVSPDASASDIMALCTSTCEHIFMCFMEPVEPECVDGCSADLVDCSAAQLDQIADCNDVACPSGAEPVLECLMAVTCIEMG